MELPTKKTICLNMIVKDESHVIVDTLHNLWSYIQFDTYVVSDTGSSDNTKELIKTFFELKGVSGTITDDPWLNFGHNRTVAFNHAYNKSDYVFVWDADDRIKGDFKLPSPLTADSYSFSFGSYSRRQLFNNRKHWKYVGVLHECPTCCEEEGREEKVTGPYRFESNRTGARNKDPLKYLKDGQILEKAFYEALEAKDSIHMRYAYYCANSYNSTTTHKEKAIEFYKKVLTLDNWHQEKYNSCIELFQLHDQQGKTQEALHWLVESHKYDKTRVEGIFRLIRHYCSSQPEVAFAYYTLIQDYVENRYLADNIAVKLFVKNTEYEFYLPYFMIIVADKVKRKEVGGKMFEILFQKAHVPGEWWTRNVFTNIQFFLDHLPKTPEFFLSMTNYLDACKKAGHTFTPEHHVIVDKVLAKAKPVLGGLERLSRSLVPPFKDRGVPEKIHVMFSITTCKRLDLFQKTIASILRCWTDLDHVDYFYCVDDNSSEEDRTIMRTNFPFFDYLMKGPEQRGHMKSMNLIWNRLQEVKPTYWIHMEDDWLFFKQEAYVARAIKVLESYKDQNVHQVVFNKNYGLMMADMDRTGGKMLDPMTRLHIKIDQQPGRHAGFWPHYSLQPSMCRTETILNVGDYTTTNKFFERDYANKYFAKGFQTAFFEGIHSLHIGKQHWETEGQNAYALNAESQFNWQNSVAKQQSDKKNEDANLNIVIQPEPESHPIVEQKESEQKQEWQPVTYPKFHYPKFHYPLFQGTMADHLNQLKGLMTQKIPVALIRPSDGEYSVIKGQTLTNCDKWTFQAGGQLQTDLLQAVQTDISGLYVGIPCNTCNKPWNCTQTIYDDYRGLLKTQNITYANLFMNANWPAFVQMLKEDTRPLYVVTSGRTGTTDLQIRGRHIIDPFLVNKWDTEGLKETEKILEFVKSKTNALICFSAGPLSKVWIPKCWALNPTNTYLDVGAALDPFTKGPEVKSRFYTDRGHAFAKEACFFRERHLLEPSSKKSLVYMCVFHNKNYLQLLELLLGSMKLFSNTNGVDVLVMTSPDFEKEVQQISELVQIPIKTHLCDFKTLHESSCARLYIHNYSDIDQYDKILYIDTDILVQNDLTPLLSEPLEDKIYALGEGTIEHEYHGGWYFDFNTINKDLPGMNGGILLFPNTPTIRTLMKECIQHIESDRATNKPMPACLDQPFLNYHFVKVGCYDVTLMKKYALIYCIDPPPPPSEPTTIALCHFVWPIGNAFHKLNRMRNHMTHLLTHYTNIYPSVSTPTVSILGKSFYWSNSSVTFLHNNVLATIWKTGTYEWLDTYTLHASWSRYSHIIRFNDTFDQAISIRKGDCNMSKHMENKNPFFYKDMEPCYIPPPVTSIVQTGRILFYFCVFCKEEYVTMFKLLLFSIQTCTPLTNVDILVLTDRIVEASVQQVSKLLNIPIHTMIIEGIKTAHNASSARLDLFKYPPVYTYERVLYLDTDMLVQHDLTPLLTMPIEDCLYAVKGSEKGTDYCHGSWFFEDAAIMNRAEAFCAGTFLIKPTTAMRDIFIHTKHHITQTFTHNLPYPVCYEQPYLNYHSITAGKSDTQLLKPYLHLDHSTIEKPSVPLSEIAMIHYVDDKKIERMLPNLTRMVFEGISSVPVEAALLNESYTWNTGYVKFLENNRIITTWGTGTYQQVDTTSVLVSWKGFVNRLFFNEDRSEALSIRKGDCNMSKHMRIDNNRKSLIYACVFYNKDYIQLLRLLLISIKMYSPLKQADFLVITSKEFEPLIQALSAEIQLPIRTMTLDITTIFQAACARLSIFDYPSIQDYAKLLYLDTDILVKGDITTLLNIPLEEKLYALESGSTDSINFGVQFFQPPIKVTGLNSGTLLFPNSPIIKALFNRIQTHINTYEGVPPYALDQPFINYHAIKDGLYENQALKSHVALFEEEQPANEKSAIICHFSFPIGNFAHKFYRMKKYFDKILSTRTPFNEAINIQGKTYSWDKGFIKFNSQNLQTTWASGTWSQVGADRVLASWRGCSHVLRLSPDRTSWFSIRLHDFVVIQGALLDTMTPNFNPSIQTPLCDIMTRHGSDKGGKRHNYTTLYYNLLHTRQQEPLRIFEVGIGTTNLTIANNMGADGRPAASLRGWAEFFPNARIFAADIDKTILFQEDRIKTFYTDQLDRITIKGMWLQKELQEPFDLIVDDGLHTYDANVCFLENSIHKLRVGGYYIVEDIRNCDVPLFYARLEGWRLAHPSYTFQLLLLEYTNIYDNTLFVIHRAE